MSRRLREDAIGRGFGFACPVVLPVAILLMNTFAPRRSGMLGRLDRASPQSRNGKTVRKHRRTRFALR